MNKKDQYKIATIVLSILLIAAIGWTVHCIGDRAWLNLQCAFAVDQTEIFDDMLEQSLKSDDPVKIAGYLEYTLIYYPSDTKQAPGSKLDKLVESHRRLVVRRIIEHLRAVTKKDLGDDPKAWIEQYGNKENGNE